MTNDIEKLLAEVREPLPAKTGVSVRRRVLIGAGILGVASVLVSGGAWAFGAVETLADPPPLGDTRAVALPDSPSSPAIEPAPTETPAATPSPATTGGPTAPFDVTTDVTTIAIPADFSPDEVANAKVWLTQQSIIAECMGDQGFHYTYTAWWLIDPKTGGPELPAEGEGPGTPFWTARWGEDDQPSGVDYDWQQAGCHGYAVHVTGMDDAN